ncbi:MAG: hypothetical protein LBT84_03645 [Spirochaetia bacterium]|jgi:hypothetical protein|nr:hypothetical protein [Spirochaetia bacterium]
MDKEDINQIVSKIRSKYYEYGKKHGEAWFNPDGFEERYHMAIKNRMELEGFFLSEITFLEKLKEKYDKKAAEKPFSATVESIIEENTAKIKKYPKIEFHQKAGFEICHFYGAMDEFAQHYFQVFRILDIDDSSKEMTIKYEDELFFLAVNMGARHPKRIQDHILLVSRQDAANIEIERDTTDYLKSCAFLLHEIIDLCEGIVDRQAKNLETPLRFNKLFIEDNTKKAVVNIFSGLTGYGALLAIAEQARGIIDDFRMKAFSRRGLQEGRILKESK